MKAMIVLLTGPLMLFFTISIFSTIEYCFETGHPVNYLYMGGIVVLDIIWWAAYRKCTHWSLKKAMYKYERFLEQLLIKLS